ncbi:glycosyltransferase family 9 protein [Candidatus Latescibacterota bacterium]
MNGIAEFIRKKINLVRYGSIYLPDNSPPVNITKILRQPKNILILPYNRLGTILLSTRVFKSFREHFPEAKITAAVNDTWSIIVKNDATIDEVFTYGDEINNPHSKAFESVGKRLAENKYDLTFFLSYQFDMSLAYLSRLSHSDIRVSFQSGEEAQFFNVEIVPAPGVRYEVDRYIEMLRTLGIKSSMREFTMTITDSVRNKARSRYLPGVRKRRLVGFDLTQEIVGEQMSKRIAESMIKTLIQDIKAEVIVFYEPDKRALAASLKESLGNNVIPVEDRPISMVAGLLSFCSFVLTHNTDLFQLSAALKVPTLSMLTKNEAIQWSPPENRELIHIIRPDSSWPSSNTIVTNARRLVKQNKEVE